MSVNPSICGQYLTQAACNKTSVFGHAKSLIADSTEVEHRLQNPLSKAAAVAAAAVAAAAASSTTTAAAVTPSIASAGAGVGYNPRGLALDGFSTNFSFFQGREKSERGRKTFLCPQCHYVTDRKNNLKRHIITMHQDCAKVLECCGFVFRSKASLREHVSLFHSTGYGCRICGRNFCRKALLRRHLSVHSGQKDFLCPFCSYATSHKSNLERHQKVHSKKSGSSFDHHSLIELSSESAMTHRTKDKRHTNDGSNSSRSSNNNSNNNSSNNNNNNAGFLPPHQPSDLSGDARRLRKMFLRDRLSQTYSEVAHELNRATLSASDVFYKLMNPSKRMKRASSPTLIDERDNDDEEDDFDPDRRTIRRKTPRIFMASYKCIDCRNIFSHQSLLNAHSCVKNRHYEDSYLSIVHPLARRQISSSNGVWHDSDIVCIDSVVKRKKTNVNLRTDSPGGNADNVRNVMSYVSSSISGHSRSVPKTDPSFTVVGKLAGTDEKMNDAIAVADDSKKADDKDNSEELVKSEEYLSIEYIDIDDMSETVDDDGDDDDHDGDGDDEHEDEDNDVGDDDGELNLPPKKRQLK
ncbi:hypothetical protein Ahia01_001158600 [Argonauta hians]